MKAKKKQKAHATHRSSRHSTRTKQTRQAVQMEENPIPTFGERVSQPEGGGPLNQEGEGNRQNDQLAELEEIKPDIQQERK